MKNIKTLILIIACLLYNLAATSQTSSSNLNSKEYYLTKSKHQKTLAWVMLSGGVALAGVGAALVNTKNVTDLGATNQNGAGAIIAIVGGVSALGSIPVFISAAHNKRKAAELAFDMKPIPSIQFTKTTVAFQPSLTLKLKL